ncbi:rCG63482 [Rattus norvegicus]|uniref:RCG63482 n=1 Tax=Rattus norvegicus TaxID=10116 RepID=A6HFC0_RAT|nr:rCG63482 [Rattus norvegicus]
MKRVREEWGKWSKAETPEPGLSSPGSCIASAEEASSQSCVVPGPDVSGCPFTGIPFPLRAMWLLGF